MSGPAWKEARDGIWRRVTRGYSLRAIPPEPPLSTSWWWKVGKEMVEADEASGPAPDVETAMRLADLALASELRHRDEIERIEAMGKTIAWHPSPFGPHGRDGDMRYTVCETADGGWEYAVAHESVPMIVVSGVADDEAEAKRRAERDGAWLRRVTDERQQVEAGPPVDPTIP